MYNNLRIIELNLKSEKGNIIKGKIHKTDSFNAKFLKELLEEKVVELTTINIDNLELFPTYGDVVFVTDDSFSSQTESYDMEAECLVGINGVYETLKVSVNKKIWFKSCFDRRYNSKEKKWIIESCGLCIPYGSKIIRQIIVD